MFSTINWFEHRNPLCLPEYNVRYQSQQYDSAMRHYGDVCHAQADDETRSQAWAHVQKAKAEVYEVMDAVAKEKHQEFVLRSVC